MAATTPTPTTAFAPPSILADIEADMSPEAGALFTDLVAGWFAETRRGEGPVSTPRSAAELAPRFAEPMPLDGRPLEEVVARVARDVLPDCNRLWHPMYAGHQVSAALPAAEWAESLVGALNQSLAVWEMSPTITVLETQLVRWCCELVGWGAGAGGTFTSGGTEATFAALLAARARALPDAWRDGMGTSAPLVLCGEHAHYAVARAVGEMGLGLRNLVVVPSRDWRMDVGALAAALDAAERDGRTVLAVVATAGSTATGSFDDLEAIGALCEARGAWLHVDGAHGASALLSDAHAPRLRGLHRARSIAWDPHKMMLLPLSAGMVLVRDERELEAAFAQKAPYLFHAGDDERVWDQGVRSFQCSRRADALKAWIALQRHGRRGIAALYEHLCATTAELHAMLAAHPRFAPLHAPESNILCFRWTGDASTPPRDEAALDAVNQHVRAAFNRSGTGWITATTLGGRRVLRVTVMNPRTRGEHLRRMVDALDATALAVA